MKRKIAIALDWDDVVAPLNQVAVELYNERNGTHMKLEQIEKWTDGDRFLRDIYLDLELYRRQKPDPAFLEVIPKLQRIGNVYIASNPFPQHYGIRREQIHRFFPSIPDPKIYLGPGKETIPYTFLLDDNDVTVGRSNARVPVCFDQPWNREYEGNRVKDAYQFLDLIERFLSRP